MGVAVGSVDVNTTVTVLVGPGTVCVVVAVVVGPGTVCVVVAVVVGPSAVVVWVLVSVWVTVCVWMTFCVILSTPQPANPTTMVRMRLRPIMVILFIFSSPLFKSCSWITNLLIFA